jgi:iron complex transport system substrate-binding protein
MFLSKGIKLSSFFCVLGLLVACNQNVDTTSKEADKQTSIQITDFANRTVEFPEVPKTIVALGSGDVDLMNAFGIKVAGKPTNVSDNLIDSSVKDVPEIGTTHEINYEQVALIHPDVVMANAAFNQDDVTAIEGVGSKVVLTEANSIEDIKRQVNLYGQMLQEESEAAEITESLTRKLEEIKKQVVKENKRVLLVYGAPGTYMAALPNSLSGDILTHAGGINIASDYPALEKFPQYAQINTERVVEANPDAVLLITHGSPDEIKKSFLKEMEQNSAWNSITAVKEGKVEVLPSELFGTNPGTKVTEAVSYLVELLNSME